MKKMMVIGAGVLVGLQVAPMILNALNIPRAEGFGMDDIVTALLIAGTVIAVDRLI